MSGLTLPEVEPADAVAPASSAAAMDPCISPFGTSPTDPVAASDGGLTVLPREMRGVRPRYRGL